MKHLQRAMSLILLSALVCGTFSCGETTTDQSGETTPATEPSVTTPSDRLDELGEKDLSGKTLRFLDANGSPNIHQNIPYEVQNGEVINDALIARDRYLTERFGFDIEYEQPSQGEGITAFRNSVLAGDKNYDVVVSVIGNAVGNLASAGVLANLNSFEYLSLDREWWSPLIYESCKIGGIMYYTAGDIAPSIYCAPGCIYINKKLAADYKISVDEVYDSVKSGKWTIDYLGKLTKDLSRDLNNDDLMKADDDFFGMLNEPNQLTAAVFLAGAGVDLSTIDKNGNLSTELGSEHTVDAIGKLKSVLTDAKYENLHSAFIEDRAIFMMHYVSSAYTRYRDMESDFSIVPVPKYDESQSTYRSLVNTWCNSFVGVAADADPEFVPFVMEAMAYYSHENVRPHAYDNAFKQKGARDERDAEMLDMIFDTLYLDFNSFSNFGGSIEILIRALFQDGSFSSEWASVNESTLAAMEKFQKNWTERD